jgi:hypothetical protein
MFRVLQGGHSLPKDESFQKVNQLFNTIFCIEYPGSTSTENVKESQAEIIRKAAEENLGEYCRYLGLFLGRIKGLHPDAWRTQAPWRKTIEHEMNVAAACRVLFSKFLQDTLLHHEIETTPAEFQELLHKSFADHHIEYPTPPGDRAFAAEYYRTKEKSLYVPLEGHLFPAAAEESGESPAKKQKS